MMKIVHGVDPSDFAIPLEQIIPSNSRSIIPLVERKSLVAVVVFLNPSSTIPTVEACWNLSLENPYQPVDEALSKEALMSRLDTLNLNESQHSSPEVWFKWDARFVSEILASIESQPVPTYSTVFEQYFEGDLPNDRTDKSNILAASEELVVKSLTQMKEDPRPPFSDEGTGISESSTMNPVPLDKTPWLGY